MINRQRFASDGLEDDEERLKLPKASSALRALKHSKLPINYQLFPKTMASEDFSMTKIHTLKETIKAAFCLQDQQRRHSDDSQQQTRFVRLTEIP
ncbi:hypothetical protein E3N88_04580 [Mikania micrantha]|uniref:Uncharacterized protein n=1 Tax=Mikania micrantha TaxID=192012 RepID=A0A5N6PVC4_9ASTR|nr:hypothetical protein E3N88_04580 [Mikania micrantha]